jgi:hypothetical protein
MRDLDDKIIYTLNMNLPTESIKKRSASDPEKNCKDLYQQLSVQYSEREKIINECILVSADEVKKLKKQHEEDINNVAIEKKFKSEQRKVSFCVEDSFK